MELIEEWRRMNSDLRKMLKFNEESFVITPRNLSDSYKFTK